MVQNVQNEGMSWGVSDSDQETPWEIGCLPYQLVSPETFEERIAHIAHWNSASSMHINIGRNKLEPFDEHAPTKTYQELYSFDNLNGISDTPKALHFILNLRSLKLTVRP